MVLGFTYYRSGAFWHNLRGRVTLKNRVLKIAKESGVDGFTLLSGLGAWQGQTEPTYQLQIEHITTRKAEQVARKLKQEFSQDSIMVKNGRTTKFV